MHILYEPVSVGPTRNDHSRDINSDLVDTILEMEKQGFADITIPFRQQTEKRFRDLMARYGVSDEAKALPTDFRLSYISHASIGAIVWWLENDQPCNVEQLARWIGQLSSNSAGLLFQYK